MKSFPISFKQGIRVPQYWDKDRIEQSRGTINKASSERMSKACSINSWSCLDRPTIPRPGIRHRTGKGVEYAKLTHDREDDANTYHGHVEEIPDIRCVKDGSGIAPLAQLIVSKGCEPDVEQDLRHADSVRVPFHKDGVVEVEEASEEDDLEGLKIPGNSKTRKWIRRCLVVETRFLDRVNGQS